MRAISEEVPCFYHPPGEALQAAATRGRSPEVLPALSTSLGEVLVYSDQLWEAVLISESYVSQGVLNRVGRSLWRPRSLKLWVYNLQPVLKFISLVWSLNLKVSHPSNVLLYLLCDDPSSFCCPYLFRARDFWTTCKCISINFETFDSFRELSSIRRWIN